MFASQDSFRVSPEYQPLVQAAGLSARGVFSDPRIRVWRSLSDRENGTLDVALPNHKSVRLHIKRYPASTSLTLPHLPEVRGHLALQLEKVPTAPMVGYGKLTDRRSFTIFLDLAGYTPADKLIGAGTPFETLLQPTADLAAKLHNAGLHHRDLYLCHFMAKLPNPPAPDAAQASSPDEVPDVKLIDVARVGRLSNPFTRRRWIVKDLAQFWYSTTKLPVSDDQRQRWLARYAQQRGMSPASLEPALRKKVWRIAWHDLRLNAQQPNRNVSIPTS